LDIHDFFPISKSSRHVGRGEAVGAAAPPDSGPAFTACPTRFLAPLITRPPRFSDLATCLSSITKGPGVYKSSYSSRQVIINLSRVICFVHNSNMLLEYKILVIALILNFVHSNYEVFDNDLNTDYESCIEPK
jgi:hypothetical protein